MKKEELEKIYDYVEKLHKEQREISHRLDTIFISIAAASLPAILTIISKAEFTNIDSKRFLLYATYSAISVIFFVFLKLALERKETNDEAKKRYKNYNTLSKSNNSELETAIGIVQNKNEAAEVYLNDKDKLISCQNAIYLSFIFLIIFFEIAIYKI